MNLNPPWANVVFRHKNEKRTSSKVNHVGRNKRARNAKELLHRCLGNGALYSMCRKNMEMIMYNR